ncbi:hypothetical protein LEMLEM_LOCUS24902, partial [Lemmus lemmus]
GNPAGETCPQNRQHSRRQPLLPPLGVSQEEQTCRGPRSVPCRLPGSWFGLCDLL